MKIKNLDFLRFIYNGLLMGMPSFTYNPINKNNLLAPMCVNKFSTYINFKLNDNQVNYMNDYIDLYTDSLELIPLKMSLYDRHSYYISVNIYNCTSPVFPDKRNITRCEINTYVKNKDGTKGTIILDYLSNGLSLDPLNVFKKQNNIEFKNTNKKFIIDCLSIDDEIDLRVNFSIDKYNRYNVNDKLIDYTDNIYYKNGIMDKIYYDSTLTKAVIKQPIHYQNNIFKYRDMYFDKVSSIFYFDNDLNFVGSIWDNIYKLNN